jgi:hypothetical protein
MQLSRTTAIACFLLFVELWCVLFAFDAGNFWHGGSALGLVATQGAATLGMLAFVEVLRSDAHKGLKLAFGIAALPLLFFVGGSLFFAALKIFER